MTDTPPPFGPPQQPNQPNRPNAGGDPTAGHSLAGLLLGFFIAILPAGIFGTLLAIFTNVDAWPGLQVLVAIVSAIVIPVAIFLLVSNRLKDGTAEQQSMRTAMRIIVFIALGTYALGIIVVGACIALLVGSY